MDTEKKFIKGFNHGYILAEHEPDLLNKIVKSLIELDSKNDYVQGVASGKEELEKARTHLDDLNRLRNKSQDRDRALDRE